MAVWVPNINNGLAAAGISEDTVVANATYLPLGRWTRPSSSGTMRQAMNDPSQPLTAPPGWFPDAEQVGQLRYWDGRSWTEHRVPAPARKSQPRRQLMLVAAMIAAILGGLLLMATFPFVAGEPDQDGVKDVPGWTSVVSGLGIGMLALAAVLAMVGVVQSRRNRPQ